MALATHTPLSEIFARHPHWQQALIIVRALNAKGYTAYLAGGAVRDALLGRPVHDFDIVTSAKPDELEKLIKSATGQTALDIGKQFGIMMIPLTGYGGVSQRIEIATFRADGLYLDGRHPQSVTFSSAEEDAKRRDFTVNALFYDMSNNQVIDYVSGLNDLKDGIIRAVGNPKTRFNEDKLRLLRAVRFSAQLGFQIEAETFRAIQELASEINMVSRERITVELERLAQSKNLTAGFATLFETGLFGAIFKPLKFVESETVRLQFIRALTCLSGIGSLELILALMLIVEETYTKVQLAAIIFESHLSLSRAAQHRIQFLLNGVHRLQKNDDEVLMQLDKDDGPLLSELGFALEAIDLLPPHRTGEILEQYLKLTDSSGKLPAPFVDGHDLKNIGVPPGPKFGEILTVLYKKQLRGEISSRDQALSSARQMMQSNSVL